MLRRFRIGRVSLREWLGLAAAVLAGVSPFLNWTVLTTDNPAVVDALRSLPYGSTHRDAFGSGVYAVIPPVLIVLAGIVVVALGQFRAVRGAGLPHLWLIGSAVAVALSVIGFFAMGAQFGDAAGALLAEAGVVTAAGIGRWLCMAAAVLSLLAATLDVFAMRSEIPQRGRAPRTASRGR